MMDAIVVSENILIHVQNVQNNANLIPRQGIIDTYDAVGYPQRFLVYSRGLRDSIVAVA